MFSIRVLGGYSLTGPDGEAVTHLTQRRVDAVLAVLAVAGDRGATRHRLLGLLWGELDERHARHNLSVALHVIRRALGADAVTSVGETLFLNPAVVSADTTAFAAAAGSPRSLEGVQAYRGLLLDGFHVNGAPAFERWVEDERARLSREYAEALERLATEAEGAGEPEHACTWWTRAVEHDPHNTRLVVRLMRALAAAGDRANALRAAETHRERLRLELDLDPEPDLDAEVESIRRGRAPNGSSESPGAPQAAPPVPRTPVAPPELERETDPAPSVSTAARPWRRLGLAAGVMLVAAASWATWHQLRRRERPLVFANTRQVAREPGLELWPAISPDGREVAYMAGAPERVHIAVRDVGGGRPRVLTGDWEGSQVWPRWTANGDSIRFYNIGAPAGQRRGLWVIPRMGGEAMAMSPQASHAGGTRRWVEWHEDTAFARDSSGALTRLFVEGHVRSHSYLLSPDGSAFAYVVGNQEYMSLNRIGNVSPSAIWVVRVGEEPVQVTEATSLNVSPAWLPDGRLLFVSDRDGPRDLYVVRPGRRRSRPLRLTTGLDAYTVTVSADGRTVAYDRFLQRRNIYVLSIPAAGSVSIREARPLTALDQIVEQTGISADGKWLAFDSDLNGNQDIYIMPAAGGEPHRLTRHPGPDYSPELTADGMEIVFHSLRGATRDIYLINADGTGETRLTDDGDESYNPTISPDGLRVAYERYPFRIALVQRATRAAPWSPPESLTTGRQARWAPDGGRLLASGPGPSLHVVEQGGTERLIPLYGDSVAVLGCAEWAPDGRSVYFCGRTAEGDQGVFEVAEGGGTPQLVVRLDDGMQYFAFSVGPDRFYFARPELQSDVFVMDVVSP